jgi:hypothetical protein
LGAIDQGIAEFSGTEHRGLGGRLRNLLPARQNRKGRSAARLIPIRGVITISSAVAMGTASELDEFGMKAAGSAIQSD